MKMTYAIEGVHCQSCLDKIQKVLLPYVLSIELSKNPTRVTLELNQVLTIHELNAIIRTAGSYQLIPLTQSAQKDSLLKTYYPLFLVASYITVISFLSNIHQFKIDFHGWMNQFMAGFFLVFSAFKLIDLKGFATGYASYDLLAKHYKGYGLVYPFLELGLGLLYLLNYAPFFTNIFTIFLMGFSSLGVLQALLKKQTIRCACLGTVLNVPLSNITLVEDILMVLLALFSIVNII